ncbi:hypothetical protein AB3Y13_22950 [Vibrio alginolyticus]
MNDETTSILILLAFSVGLLIWAKSSGYLEKIMMALAASIGAAVAICVLVFELTIKTIPIWGGALIIYWIFS